MMIGVPDNYYSAEERTSAYDELMEALLTVNTEWEEQSIREGICTECGGSGYQDGDYDSDEDSCDGSWHYGCDEGEMVGASWVEIINHDIRMHDREISRNTFDREKAIESISRYVKYMDDSRLASQQVKIDYPHLGRVEISELVTAGMKKAGLI